MLAGAHADVDQFTPEKLQITAEESLDLIHRAAMTPIMGRWNVLIVEDSDRLNEVSGNALLKSLEEPSPRTVWILCAPTSEDVLPTIVSRTRQVRLHTPATHDVAQALVRREGIDPAVASFAARAAQGHIGRARALARDEQVRLRRAEVLAIPGTLRSVPACFVAAQNLLDAASADAAAITDALDATELAALSRAYGEGATGAMAARVKRTASAATKDLEARQKSRRTRTVRDQIDRALLDLTGLYRDVLVLQTRADGGADQRRDAADRRADGRPQRRPRHDGPARSPGSRPARSRRVRGPVVGTGGAHGAAGARFVSLRHVSTDWSEAVEAGR